LKITSLQYLFVLQNIIPPSALRRISIFLLTARFPLKGQVSTTPVANLPPVSTTPAANFATSFTSVPTKLLKFFLIEDFSHLPPVSTTPVVNLELRISPRIFEKIRNGPNGILSGWGETD
jgi:hypothetical protein